MDILAMDELTSFNDNGAICVSLYMPTQRGAGCFENRTRLLNLIEKAEQELEARCLGEAARQDLIGPIQSLADDIAYWDHPDLGLAIFARQGFFRAYRLPVGFEETVSIGTHFLIRPLLPLLSGDGPFCVLALSQNSVRLLEGTRFTIREIALKGVPQSLSEALKHDEPQAHQSVNYNSGRPFPGNTEPKEDRKEKIARFFHLVDEALPKSIKNGSVPLVLASVEYEAAIFRKLSACPNVMEQGITGNPEHLSSETLHDRAWQIVQPVYQQAKRQAAAQYSELIGTGLASNNIQEIVGAAQSGRVASLLVTEGPSPAAHFDPSVSAVNASLGLQAGDEDFVNIAAIETLLHGGTVYSESVLAQSCAGRVAATLRY